MNPDALNPRPILRCRLLNGTICAYICATKTSEPPMPKAFYLGMGVIHSINDIPQDSDQVLHFWL